MARRKLNIIYDDHILMKKCFLYGKIKKFLKAKLEAQPTQQLNTEKNQF